VSNRLGDLIEVYIAERCRRGTYRPSTARSNRRVLTTFARGAGEDIDPRRLRRSDLERWLDGRKVSPATLRRQFSVLHAFFTWLVATERIRRHPMVGLVPPPEPRRMPRGLPNGNVARLFAQLDTRGQLMASLMVQEGLRCAEVAALQLGDIDFEEAIMLVTGKGGHQRVLPISDETLGYIRRYLAECPASAGPLIRSAPNSRHPGRALSPGYISNLMSEWMSAAGIKQRPYDGVSAHALRHTAATDVLRNGAHIRDVQAFLGHASLSTTARYLPWAVHDLRKVTGGRRYGR
jgi:site-specific recombinase XerD